MSDVILYDSQTAFQGGMQSGVDPALVADHQYYKGINVSCREGRIDVRPSFDKLNLDITNLELSNDEYDAAELAITNALADYNNAVQVADSSEADYLASILTTEGSIAAARANPIIAGIETAYGITLTESNLSDFLHYVSTRNTNGTGILDRAITSQRALTIGPHYECAVVLNNTGTYTDHELWFDFLYYIERACQLGLHEPAYTYRTWTQIFLENISIVTATEADEALYNDSFAAYQLLGVIDGSVDGPEYTQWQADLAIIAEMQIALTYANNILSSTLDYAELFRTGKFQGAEIYETNNRNYIVEVIGGHIFMIELSSGKVTAVTTTQTRLNPFLDRCYLLQAENYMIVQDGIGQAKILEGASLRESDPTIPEIPRGTNMAYGHGRIAVQVSGRHFMMGDIYLAYDPANILKTIESGFINEGGGFTVSSKMGQIISLQYAKVSDTSTGDGPLLAICDNGFVTYAVNNPRVNWNNIDISKEQLFGTGIVGKDAFCHISEDILYRSYEGIRSYQVGQRESASAYKYTELSKEVESYIQNDMQFNGRFLSMTFFDKRMLSLTAPKGIKARVNNYLLIEQEYANARNAAISLPGYESLTDDQAEGAYETQLVYIFDNTITWTAKGGYLQGNVDTQVTSINADPDDKIARIEKLIIWADSTEVAAGEFDDLAVLKAYADQYRAYVLSFVDDTFFKGIIAFDFSLAGYTKSTQDSQYARVTTGSYDGIWTGIKATKLLTTILGGSKRCFVTAKRYLNPVDGYENCVYEITRRQDGFDNRRAKKIESVMETRAMPFKQEQTYVPAPFVLKKLEDITLWVSNISGNVDIKIYISSDVVNAYTQVGELNLKALTESQTDPRTIGAPQSRAMIPLWDLPDLSDPTTKDLVRVGNEFMFRLVWTGNMQLRRFFTASRKLAQDRQNNKETTAIAYPVDDFDQYRYSSE